MQLRLTAVVVGMAGAALLGAYATASSKSAPPLNDFVIDGKAVAQRFPAGPSITFRYPSNWDVTTRRIDDVLDPRTLFAAATYRIPGRPRDDCDGTHARGRPRDGAFVLVKETLDKSSLHRSLPRLSDKPRHFRLPADGRAGCLPPASVAYRFRVAQRAFYVWISVGPKASPETRDAVRAFLDSIWIARYPAP